MTILYEGEEWEDIPEDILYDRVRNELCRSNWNPRIMTLQALSLRSDDGSGWTLAHWVVSKRQLPPDVSPEVWELTSDTGWTVAHQAARCGTLPENFTAWHLRAPCSGTVAQVAAARGNLPPGFNEWELVPRC